MNEIKTYQYNNTIYEFKLTLAAKAEIEKEQTKAGGLFKSDNPEQNQIIQKFIKAQQNLEKVKKSDNPEDIQQAQEEFDNAQLEVLPYLDAFEEISNYEALKNIMFMLLKNNKKYKDNMTLELFEEILDDMEEKLGTEATWDLMIEIRDKVFILIEKMNQALNK